ncbi:MAG: phenylacetate--CoA ligase [Armatimonadetes bacterium]|nr:phenylacetate--CoA ligase [Armatimonadota bacterium]
MPIWNKRCETMPREDMEQLQIERLQLTVNRAYRNVRFYHKRFEKLGIEPEDVTSPADLGRLPFTTKEDLCDAYPYEMFSVPLKEIVRIHSSSGSSGQGAVIGYTRNDLRTWSDLVARVVSGAGVTKNDVLQVTFDYGLFTGGFGIHYGAERVGASVIPASGGNTERQIRIMKDFKTTALVGTPSYALHIAEVMEQMDVDRDAFSLRLGLFGGEPFPECLRAEIEDRLGISATDNYGISDVMGPGIAGECEHKCGLHVNEDHFLAELVNPSTLEPVGYGEQGELVLTTITKQGMPLIRYRTRDLTTLNPERCSCGRTTVRMSKIAGRTDDMLIIRGINVYPSQIEAILYEIEGVEPHYRIIVDRVEAMDELTVLVEVSADIITDQISRLVQLEEKIRDRIHAVVGLTPKLRLVEPKTLQDSPDAAQRVVDNRNLS